MKKPQSRNDLLVMQCLTLKASGVELLISDICEGRVVELNADRVKPIAEWARTNESICKKDFDLTVEAMTDMAIVIFFLGWAISAFDEQHAKTLKAIVAL